MVAHAVVPIVKVVTAAARIHQRQDEAGKLGKIAVVESVRREMDIPVTSEFAAEHNLSGRVEINSITSGNTGAMYSNNDRVI